MTDGSHSLFEGTVIPEKEGAGFLNLHILPGVARVSALTSPSAAPRWKTIRHDRESSRNSVYYCELQLI